MARINHRRILAGALALASLGLAASHFAASESGSGSTEPPPPPVHTELGFKLSRAGLGAEPLAALGLGSAEVKAVVEAAEAHIALDPTALEEAEEAYEDAKKRYDVLARKVQSGRASQAEISECQQARTSCESAEAACTAILDGMFEAGVAGLSSANLELLATIRANRKWALPVQFLVEDRTEREWVDLADALDTRRIHQNYGEPFPQAVQSALAQEEAVSTVATAKVNLDTYLAGVQTTWNAEVSE